AVPVPADVGVGLVTRSGVRGRQLQMVSSAGRRAREPECPGAIIVAGGRYPGAHSAHDGASSPLGLVAPPAPPAGPADAFTTAGRRAGDRDGAPAPAAAAPVSRCGDPALGAGDPTPLAAAAAGAVDPAALAGASGRVAARRGAGGAAGRLAVAGDGTGRVR